MNVDMNRPLISIITCCWNAAESIEPTMLSVCEQDFRDFEHLVIDGASSDNTLSLVRRLGGSELRVLSERDSGLYDAMNKGLDLARGEYVLFLNAGDSFHSRSTLGYYAEACRRGMDIVYGDTMLVDGNRNELRLRTKRPPLVLTADSWKRGMLICHQAFMVRKSIAPKYDLRWRFSSDYEWTLKCIQASRPDRCENLNIVTIDYLEEGMTTRNHRASLIERFKIMCERFGVGTTIGSHLKFAFKKLAGK